MAEKKFSVTKNNRDKVGFLGVQGEYLVIPQAVKVGKKEVPVVRVSSNAFQCETEIQTVAILEGAVEEIGEAAMLEQLAEECTELAKAALKMARIIRKENPTPVTEKDAIANIREEYTDVVQCAGELSLTVDEEQMARKHERWEKRVRDRT